MNNMVNSIITSFDFHANFKQYSVIAQVFIANLNRNIFAGLFFFVTDNFTRL